MTGGTGAPAWKMREQVAKHAPRAAVDAEPSGRALGLAAVVTVVVCALLVLLAIGVTDDPAQPRRDAVAGSPGDPARAPRSVDGPAGAAAAGDTPGRRFADALELAPHAIDGRPAGYMIMTISDPAAVSGARLRPGDILVDLDGRPLEPERIEGLGDELSLADSLEVTYLRDGQVRKRVIDLTR